MKTTRSRAATDSRPSRKAQDPGSAASAAVARGPASPPRIALAKTLAEALERVTEFLLKLLRILALLEPLNHLLHCFRHPLPGRLRHLAHQAAKLSRVGIVLTHRGHFALHFRHHPLHARIHAVRLRRRIRFLLRTTRDCETRNHPLHVRPRVVGTTRSQPPLSEASREKAVNAIGVRRIKFVDWHPP